MKYVLVLFAVMMVLVSTVYAEENKWIDGIKFRYGTLNNDDYLTITVASGWGENQKITSTGEVNKTEERRFPVTIALPETLMNSWSFRQAYFDYTSFQNINDIAPSPGLGESPDIPVSVQINEAREKGLDYFYLRQKKGEGIIG